MKKTLSTILASSLALSLLSPSLQVANAQEMNLTTVDSVLSAQEIHTDTLATSYQAGYFEYTEIIAPEYTDGGRFSVDDRLAAVKKDGKWGYINEFNQTVIPFQYDYAGRFYEGAAIVGTKNSNGKYTVGVVDVWGKYTKVLMSDTIAPLEVSSFHDSYTFFNNGICTSLTYTLDGIYYGIILDKNGNGIPVAGYELNPYNEGVITANSNKGTNAVVLDAQGNVLWDMGNYTVEGMHKGLIPTQSGSKWGFMNYSTRDWQIEPQYKDITIFALPSYCEAFGETEIAMVQNSSGKYGGIDMNNNTVIPFNYQDLETSKEGLISYKNSNKWGFLNADAQAIIPATYSNCTTFNGGIAAVQSGSSTFLIDQKGNKVEGSEQLDSSIYFTSEFRSAPAELVTITKGGKTGYGQVIFNPELPVQGDTSDWALDKVIAAIKAELVPADQQNMYKNNVTREDFAYLALISMAARADMTVEEYVLEKTGKTMVTLLNNYPFNDTNNRYIIAAEAIGIVSGRTENTYDPYANITRQEVAAILTAMSRVTGDDVGNPPVANVVDRDTIASWALNAVDYVIDANIMGTMGANDFGPMGNCTREQTFTIMYNYYSSL